MKTLLPKLLKSRIVLAVGLLALIAAVAASTAWSGAPESRVKLEGAWICQTDNGVRSMVTYAPSDPSGLSAVFRNQMVWPPEVLTAMGIEAVTEEIAEEFVTGHRTSKYSGIWYGLVGGEIVAIFVDNSTITHLSPTLGTIAHTIEVYLATADADNDGFPDPGSQPVETVSAKSTTKRVGR